MTSPKLSQRALFLSAMVAYLLERVAFLSASGRASSRQSHHFLHLFWRWVCVESPSASFSAMATSLLSAVPLGYVSSLDESSSQGASSWKWSIDLEKLPLEGSLMLLGSRLSEAACCSREDFFPRGFFSPSLFVSFSIYKYVYISIYVCGLRMVFGRGYGLMVHVMYYVYMYAYMCIIESHTGGSDQVNGPMCCDMVPWSPTPL